MDGPATVGRREAVCTMQPGGRRRRVQVQEKEENATNAQLRKWCGKRRQGETGVWARTRHCQWTHRAGIWYQKCSHFVTRGVDKVGQKNYFVWMKIKQISQLGKIQKFNVAHGQLLIKLDR